MGGSRNLMRLRNLKNLTGLRNLRGSSRGFGNGFEGFEFPVKTLLEQGSTFVRKVFFYLDRCWPDFFSGTDVFIKILIRYYF